MLDSLRLGAWSVIKPLGGTTLMARESEPPKSKKKREGERGYQREKINERINIIHSNVVPDSRGGAVSDHNLQLGHPRRRRPAQGWDVPYPRRSKGGDSGYRVRHLALRHGRHCSDQLGSSTSRAASCGSRSWRRTPPTIDDAFEDGLRAKGIYLERSIGT